MDYFRAIAKNYEMIQGGQIANSFILLLALSKPTGPLSTTQISEIVTKKLKEKSLNFHLL
jgi:hypothetical protein